MYSYSSLSTFLLPHSLPLRVSGALAYINATKKIEKSKIAVSELCTIENAVVPVMAVVINTFVITANAVAIFAAVIIVAATDAIADADIAAAADVNAYIISVACRHE